MTPGRRLALALALSTSTALLSSALPACYDVPKPRCGFRCGPGGACPEDYTCDPADGRCHLDGSPPGVCEGPAGPDGPPAPDGAVVDAALR